jgi:hypothetical protein
MAAPTWKRCVEEVGFNNFETSNFIYVASSMYVKKYFKPEAKKEMVELTNYIRKAFEDVILHNIEWMNEKGPIFRSSISAKKFSNKFFFTYGKFFSQKLITSIQLIITDKSPGFKSTKNLLHYVSGLVASSLLAIEEIGAMGREIESRQGVGW